MRHPIFEPKNSVSQAFLPVANRRGLVGSILYALCLLVLPFHILADGGSKDSPDLQVEGFAVFGTNVTGSTVVTAGYGNVYIDGSLQVNEDLHVSGTISSTNVVSMQRQSLTRNDQWLAPNATINPVSSYLRVRGDALPVTLGTPQIGPGYPGQLLTLQGTANLLSVTLRNGDGLRTSREQPFTLGEFDTIQFIYDDASEVWVEIHRSMNRWEFTP